MAWTAERRRSADWQGQRYPPDRTDAVWAQVARLIRPAKRGGSPRRLDVRGVLNGSWPIARCRSAMMVGGLGAG